MHIACLLLLHLSALIVAHGCQPAAELKAKEQGTHARERCDVMLARSRFQTSLVEATSEVKAREQAAAALGTNYRSSVQYVVGLPAGDEWRAHVGPLMSCGHRHACIAWHGVGLAHFVSGFL